MSDPLPLVPFAEIAADLFSYGGKTYLAIVDRLSGWPAVIRLGADTTASKVCVHLREFFVTYGVPVRLRSDGGPQFDSKDMKEFLRDWGVEHQMSSPTYPQSNGLAESAGVKTMKELVAKCIKDGVLNQNDLAKALIEFRNTPRASSPSPSMVVYNRDIRGVVPHFPLKDSWIAVQDRKDTANFNPVEHYNKKARDMEPLLAGMSVYIQNDVTKRWDRQGVIIECLPYRRYLIKLPSGRTLERNRRFLRPKPKEISPPAQEDKTEQKPFAPRRSTRQKKSPNRLQIGS